MFCKISIAALGLFLFLTARTQDTIQLHKNDASYVLYGIIEDEQGYLWISTNLGISRFNPKTETFKNYTTQDGLQSNEFNGGAYYKSNSGEIFFGGINGFNSFFPKNVQNNENIPPIFITDFLLYNQSHDYQ